MGPLENWNILEILRLGAIGLGFLLAFLAYRLLGKEQKEREPREAILASVHRYMFFAVSIIVLGIVGEVTSKFFPAESYRSWGEKNPCFLAPLLPYL